MNTTIEDRIGALESSAKRWRLAAVLLAVGMLVVIGWGAERVRIQRAPDVTASNIYVVDEKGNPQITLSAEKGDGLMSIASATGGSITMKAEKGSPSFSIHDKGGKPLVVLLISEGKGRVDVYSPDGKFLAGVTP